MFKHFQKLKKVNTLVSQINAYNNNNEVLLHDIRKPYYVSCSITGSTKRVFLRGFAEKKFTEIVKNGYFCIKQYSW